MALVADTRQGIQADTVEPNSSGPEPDPSRRSLDRRKPRWRNARTKSAREGCANLFGSSPSRRPNHYPIERPSSRRESASTLRTSIVWMRRISGPSRSLHQPNWSRLSFRRLLCAFQTRWPRAFRFALRIALPRRFVFHFTRLLEVIEIWISHRIPEECAFILFPLCFCTFVQSIRRDNNCLSSDVGARSCFISPPGFCSPLASFIYLRDFLAGGIPILRQIPIVSESFVALFWKLSFFHFAVALIVSAALLVRTWVRQRVRGSSAAEMGCLGIASQLLPSQYSTELVTSSAPRAIHG